MSASSPSRPGSAPTPPTVGVFATQQAVATLLASGPPSPGRYAEVLSTLCHGLGLAFAALWRPEDGRLRCVAVTGADASPELTRFAQGSRELRLARGEGLPGRVWEAQEAVWLTELVWDPRMRAAAGAHQAGLRSAVAVPLGTGAACAGVLEGFAATVRPPEPSTISSLELASAQLSQHAARWRAETELDRRERALGAAVNGVVIADATRPGFPIVYANPGFERLTGYRAEEIKDRPCSLLQGPETDLRAIEAFGAALEAGRDGHVTLLNYRKDGSTFWNEVFVSPVRDDAGHVVEYIGVQNDVSERRAAEDQAAYLAYHDALTGLPNRAMLARVLDRAAERARAHGLHAALVNLDLDRFKEVNDGHGHAAGDELLRQAAERLRTTVAPGDLLVRQGGDEFLLLLADLDPAHAAERALTAGQRLRAAFAAPFRVMGRELRVRASAGVSVLGGDAEDVDCVMRHADVAMYRAKRAGGGVRLYRSSRPTAAERSRDPDHASGAASPAAAHGAALEAVLARDELTSAYQPIVDLDTGEVVAYEALARGPEGSPLARPDLLFAAAEAHGRVAELDWACRAAALRGALAAPLGRPRPLFVNVEPAALGAPCPPRLEAIWERGRQELDVVLEITERALTARPADLLALVTDVRRRGWGIALDDVGADVRSLALMPLLRPDVIKLDLRLVQEQPSMEIAEIVNAVCAERERTGAVVLAEGIETEQHVALARSLGATLGQGWHFGRPAPLVAPVDPPSRPLEISTPALAPAAPTPYEVVRAVRDVRRGDKRLLFAVSLQLEQQAASLGETAVIVSAFQSAERFTPLTHRRYTLLGADAAFVAALGVGMDPEPAPGVRGAALDPADPLLGEWSVAVLGPHFAAALVAVDLGDQGDDLDRRFDFALTYDRDLVIEAASALMRRVQPLGT